MTFAVNSCTPTCKNLPYTPRSYEKTETTKKTRVITRRKDSLEHHFWVFVVLFVLFYLRTKHAE